MISIKPLSNHNLAQDFLQTYKKQIKDAAYYSKVAPSRVLFLRPSQMPFCPLHVFVQRAKYGMYGEENFSMAFYTRVGTVVHEVMQNYLCTSGKLLADYHCRECGTWHRMSYKHECCDFPTEYHEVEIDYKGIKGHIDCIYKDRQGKLWIIDFKTTSLEQGPKKKKDPGVVYREQIETYAVLVELQYGIKIEGYANSFVIRDNPMKNDPPMWCTRLIDQTRKTVLKRLKKYKAMHRQVLGVKTCDEVLALLEHGRCEDPYCRTCMDFSNWRAIKPRSDKQLQVELLNAYKIGKSAKRLPIKDMAVREQQKIDSRKTKENGK